MDDDLKIHLEAEDNASADIARVENAFDKLREKYQAMASEMESHGLNISTEGLETTIRRVETSLASMFDRIGAHEEAMAARLWVATDRAMEKQAQAAQKAANEAIAAAERRAQGEAKAREDTFFLVQSENQRLQKMREQEASAALRGISDSRSVAQKQAAAEAKSREETFFLVQGLSQKMVADDAARAAKTAAAAEQAATAERKYREDLFFFVQGENQKLEQEEAKRLQRQQAMEEQAAARRNATIRNMASGALGGAGNILGNAPGAIGSVLGSVGGAALRGVEGGLGLIGGAVKSVTGFFGGLAESISHATGRLGEFISVGVGIASVYEIVNMVERALHGIGGAIVEFQDKMTQVQSLRLGEGGALAGDFKDVQAAVVETSMLTGRSATELGNALFFIEGHGYSAADALVIMTKAAKLSASGLGETDQLVRIVTGQMVAYGANVNQTAHFFDVFAKTEQLAALPIGELSGQFQRLTPITAALHIPIEQVGAAIATISRTGLGASRVVTDLAGVLNSFVHSSPAQQKALEKIGYPIEQLRKDLTEKGLIETLTNVWQRSAHDIDAVGAIFSDRSRALIGFLALVRNSGKDLNDVFDQMANTSGTVEQIFAVNQQRMSLQWQRLTAIAQGYAIVLTNEVAPKIGLAMGTIADQLSSGDFVGAWQSVTADAAKVFAGITDTLASVAKDAFGGAYNIAIEIANGLMQGANDAIQAVVNAIADMIASFLLGHSWPPKGPLADGTAGVQRWQKEYANAMVGGQSAMTDAAGNVATAVNQELGKIGVAGSKVGIENAIANIDQQLLPWKLAADSIKDTYEAQLHPLERQIAAIQRIKDLEYERQQLGFEQRDLELRMMHLRAEGDPARRAQLAGQLASAQEQREQHSIESRIATLNRESRTLKPGQGTTPQEIGLRRREIADELNILRIQQQQHRLVNTQLLGQYETKKAQLDVDKEGASIAHSRFELEQKKTLQPLLEQRDLLKNKMQAELDIIAAQTDGLEDQRRVLEAQLKLVTAREAGQKKAAAGGAGPFRIPETGEDPLSLAGRAQGAIDRIAGSMAEGLRKRISEGLAGFSREYGPSVGQGFIGFMVGGMVAGLPGAVAGAALVPRLMTALTERGVTGADFTAFATNFVTGLRGAFGRAGERLRAGDILGTVESIMADARTWIDAFQKRFFAEWTVTTLSGPGGSETNTMRYAGIGRQIVEGIKGEMIQGPLDFASLQAAFGVLVTRIWNGLTTGTGNYGAGGEMVVGPSPLQGLFIAGLKGVDFVAGVLGAAAGALAQVFNELVTDERANKAAHDLGKSLGVLIMGGTPDGMASEEGTASFLGGLRKLDRAMLDAGTTLAKSLVTGFWDEITSGFSSEGMGLHIIPGSFLDRIRKGENVMLALVEGTANAINAQTTPTGPTMHSGGARETPAGGAVGGQWGSGPVDPATGLFGTQGPLAATGASWLTKLPEIGMDAIKGLIAGLTDSGVMAALNTAAIQLTTTFLATITGGQGFRSSSPSEAMADIGRDAVAGFNMGVTDEASSTGPIVRMWLRSEVLAQAQSILITGEGHTGGLAAVGIDAVQAFSDAFATPPPGLAENMRTLGRIANEALMDPLEDPRTGVIARMRRIIDGMPKATPGTQNTLPTPEAGARYAATGADFIVPGSGGTDSQQVALWATPGERVTVGSGASGGARNVTNHFNITVNGGDPDEVRQAVAAGIQEGMGEHHENTPNQMLNAWRTAKAQGANKPYGTQSRGARG